MATSLRRSLILMLSLVFGGTPALSAEIDVYYVPSDPGAWASLQRHAARVTRVLAMGYAIDERGKVRDLMDPRLKSPGTRGPMKVTPVVFNQDIDRPTFHRFLQSTNARLRALRELASLARSHGYAGWHFDFENIDVTDRDAYSAFCRQAGAFLRERELSLSIAVVPRPDDSPPEGNHAKWMHRYWRGAYDYRALSKAGDFITLMAYNQHARHTPPGPVASLPWVEGTINVALAAGVSPARMSLGIPVYSHHWFADASEAKGGFISGRIVSFEETKRLLGSGVPTLQWLPEAGSSMALFVRQGTYEYLSLENAKSFLPKRDLAKRLGLRGVSLFAIGREDPALWDNLSELGR